MSCCRGEQRLRGGDERSGSLDGGAGEVSGFAFWHVRTFCWFYVLCWSLWIIGFFWYR